MVVGGTNPQWLPDVSMLGETAAWTRPPGSVLKSQVSVFAPVTSGGYRVYPCGVVRSRDYNAKSVLA